MKILLVDDHFVVRDGVAALLRGLIPEVEVSEAIDGESALEAVQRSVPSLVILDIGLPGISGLEVTRRLRQRLPQLRVLFFSMHDELPLVRQALDAGAAGYITKGASPAVLVEAVRRILAGHAYIEQPLATQLARQPAGADGQDPRLQGMTQREFEIFVMLARGCRCGRWRNICASAPRRCRTTSPCSSRSCRWCPTLNWCTWRSIPACCGSLAKPSPASVSAGRGSPPRAACCGRSGSSARTPRGSPGCAGSPAARGAGCGRRRGRAGRRSPRRSR